MVELATDVRSEEPVEPVPLAEVANDVAARFRRRTGTRDRSSTSTAPVPSTGRRAMLDRAVSNLVDNALKFSPTGAAVDVTVHGTTMEVADRGPGHRPEDRGRVFDRFYRATGARTLPGSGLGLSIVAQIAELHGGTVDARAPATAAAPSPASSSPSPPPDFSTRFSPRPGYLLPPATQDGVRQREPRKRAEGPNRQRRHLTSHRSCPRRVPASPSPPVSPAPARACARLRPMRFVVYGAGAIGGVVGGRLARPATRWC